jgi:cAMP-specific phosphodiesterase 4
MKEDDKDIFKEFGFEEAKYIRERIISMVLGTDMAFHFAEIGKLKSRIGSDTFDPSGEDKFICMNSIIHFADISNSSKSFNLAKEWVTRLFEEFFYQVSFFVNHRETEKGN